MQHDLRVEGWTAWTDDGQVWRDDDAALRAGGQSPWRELEAIARREQRLITKAEVFIGLQSVAMEAQGHVLTCGFAMGTLTGVGAQSGSRYYRYVRRDEPGRTVWGICSALKTWFVTGPPGAVECPDPVALEAQHA